MHREGLQQVPSRRSMRRAQDLTPTAARRLNRGPQHGSPPNGQLNLRGCAACGKRTHTTVPETGSPCPPDRVQRNFPVSWSNEQWVVDFSHMSTRAGLAVRGHHQRCLCPTRRLLAKRHQHGCRVRAGYPGAGTAGMSTPAGRPGERDSQHPRHRQCVADPDAAAPTGSTDDPCDQRPGRDQRRPVQGPGEAPRAVALTPVAGAGHPGPGMHCGSTPSSCRAPSATSRWHRLKQNTSAIRSSLEPLLRRPS